MNINKQFNIFILNLTKNNSSLICDTLVEYNYTCHCGDNLQVAHEYIKNNTLDLLIINAHNSNAEELEIIEGIKEISDINIVFLTSEIDQVKKESFEKLNLLDYKIKLSNILFLLDEIDILINKLMLNSKEQVLVVKAKNPTRVKIESLLKLRNYNVTVASNGAQGWKAINNTENFSLIILDINLDDMDSLEILNIAKRKYNDDIPVIALATEYNPMIFQQNISNGLSDLLNMPITNEEFNLKIDLWINNVRQKREIHQQQIQLGQTLNSFRALSNATIEGLLMFENNICVDANDAALALFKYNSKEDLLNTRILDIFHDDLSSYDEKELLKNDVDHEIELNMKKQNGTIFPTRVKERNLTLDGKMLKVIAILDLTDIKRKENMLSHQSKMASMGEMIGNIAHQWRQPLTAISIAASGMKISYELDILEEDEIYEQLDSIVASTEFLSNTITDFQNFAKGNKIKENFTISGVVKKVLNLIGNNLTKANITVVENYKDDEEIFGLQNELVQALLNIINNARDAIFTQNKKMNLIIINSWNNSNGFKSISMQDSAGGVPNEIIDNVFEPYFTTKQKNQGTGMGLYMTHQIIVNHMNGKLEVCNNEFTYKQDKFMGAKFTIELPLS